MLDFQTELHHIAERVREIVGDERLRPPVRLPQLAQAVMAYPLAGGKALRPALLAWSCRALGGEEAPALRAGTAIELYHTYTLVHDDVIDHDPLRRGQPSVHALLTRTGREQFGLNEEEAVHYGLSMAILAGDFLQSWAVALLASLPELGVSSALTVELIRRMQHETGPAILEGEARDIQLPFTPVPMVTEEDTMRVIEQKTVALFTYCATAGGLLARGTIDDEVAGLTSFARGIGIAFQLQDDVLGLIGSEKQLGKPVGNDLREGKRTLILALGWARADEAGRAKLLGVLGNPRATEEQIAGVTSLLKSLEAIAEVQRKANEYLSRALAHLDHLPDNAEIGLLRQFAAFVMWRDK